MPRPKLPRDGLVQDFHDARRVISVSQLQDKRDRIGVSYDKQLGTLKITFREPSMPDGVQIFDMSNLLARPALGIPFVQAIFSHFARLRPATRIEARQAANAFFEFLPRYEISKAVSVVCLNDIGQECIDAYLAFVDARKTNLGTPIQLTTISNLRGPLRTIFKELMGIEYAGYRLPPNLDFPTMGTRGRKKGITHIPPLDDITTVRVIVASLAEVEHIVLAKPIDGLPIDNRGRILTALSLEEMVERLDALETVDADALTMREMVPFVLLLGLTTSLNASSLAGAPLSAVHKSHPIFGSSRWQLHVKKYKAKHRILKRSFAVDQFTWVNPTYLLAAVVVYSRGLRSLVSPESAHLLLLALNTRGASPLYSSNDGIVGTFDDALAKFCDDNQIGRFPLQRLRPTSSEVVHSITEGDVTAQHAALQHTRKSKNLTTDTYTHEAAITRDTERLARAMQWRETFIKSRGKIDARIARGDVRRALRAATPGFACIDIFDSPYPGQLQGHPCTAYCMCSACPLGTANISDHFSVARLLQVEAKLIQGKSVINEERWIRDYKPQLEELQNTWLPLVCSSVLKLAKKHDLPDIPDIE